MVTRRIRVRVRGNWHTVEVPEPLQYPLQVVVDGEALEVEVEPEGEGPAPPPETQASGAPSAKPPAPIGLRGITEGDSKLVRCPMPGRIVAVSVKVWDELKPGAEICVLETMKMEQSVQASREGVVRAVFVEPGGSIAAGEPLIQLE